ncbi:PIN domain-containing protein [Alicyclobacillus tolerans]|uniref:PIN domain-containing protein n=1 Tax=Alicyclobacillus tolerans TaxID=90970 RepID=UPI001F39203C|nr:PIN domain-containing protein [Alicyclobacillus tolerans]MCF8568475.1 PIN domain-containing protein [Alicyclobacillus tolerans]
MSNLVVFFDADVLVAGSASTTGAAHLLLTLSELGIIQGITSDHVQEEARRNLAKKIPDALPEFEEIIRRAVTIDSSLVDTTPFHGSAHPKDIHVLAAAIVANARWLVSFNLKDFYQPSQITVLNPGQAIRTIRETLGHVNEQLR